MSDALLSYRSDITDTWPEVLAYGCLSPQHATQFKGFIKQVRSKFQLAAIIKGDASWPHHPEDRDVLYFLTQSFRAQLIKELSAKQSRGGGNGNDGSKGLAFRAKALLRDLANINLDMAQMVVHQQDEGEDNNLPDWFVVELVRDLPRLMQKNDKKNVI